MKQRCWQHRRSCRCPRLRPPRTVARTTAAAAPPVADELHKPAQKKKGGPSGRCIGKWTPDSPLQGASSANRSSQSCNNLTPARVYPPEPTPKNAEAASPLNTTAVRKEEIQPSAPAWTSPSTEMNLPSTFAPPPRINPLMHARRGSPAPRHPAALSPQCTSEVDEKHEWLESPSASQPSAEDTRNRSHSRVETGLLPPEAWIAVPHRGKRLRPRKQAVAYRCARERSTANPAPVCLAERDEDAKNRPHRCLQRVIRTRCFQKRVRAAICSRSPRPEAGG